MIERLHRQAIRRDVREVKESCERLQTELKAQAAKAGRTEIYVENLQIFTEIKPIEEMTVKSSRRLRRDMSRSSGPSSPSPAQAGGLGGPRSPSSQGPPASDRLPAPGQTLANPVDGEPSTNSEQQMLLHPTRSSLRNRPPTALLSSQLRSRGRLSPADDEAVFHDYGDGHTAEFRRPRQQSPRDDGPRGSSRELSGSHVILVHFPPPVPQSHPRREH